MKITDEQRKAIDELQVNELVMYMLSKIAQICIDTNAKEAKLSQNMEKIGKRIELKIVIKDLF